MMLLTQQFFEVFESVDSTVEVDLIYEEVCHLDILQLSFYLWFRAFFTICFAIYHHHLYIVRHFCYYYQSYHIL